MGMPVVSPPTSPPSLYNLDKNAAVSSSPSFAQLPMSTFFTSELDRSLREQSFGIAGFETMRPTGSLEASAHVTLLEGDVVTISLTSRGYQLVKNRPQAGKVYEAIEALLQSASAAYERKQRDTLFAKLEKLSYA